MVLNERFHHHFIFVTSSIMKMDEAIENQIIQMKILSKEKGAQLYNIGIHLYI